MNHIAFFSRCRCFTTAIFSYTLLFLLIFETAEGRHEELLWILLLQIISRKIQKQMRHWPSVSPQANLAASRACHDDTSPNFFSPWRCGYKLLFGTFCLLCVPSRCHFLEIFHAEWSRVSTAPFCCRPLEALPNFQATTLTHQPLPLPTIDTLLFGTLVGRVDVLLGAINYKMCPLMGSPVT